MVFHQAEWLVSVSSVRKILFVTGTRADFGLMASTLKQIHEHPLLRLEVVVTGMHLSDQCGATVRDIEQLNLPIVARLATDVELRTGAAMAGAIGQMIIQLTPVLEHSRPDIVLVIGDRGEMLAAAIAALHMGIPVAHLHGGERSGTVDESVRHAITKLSHWHFVATEESRDRVVALGERPENVWITGAPSLDDLERMRRVPRSQVLAGLGLPAAARYALVLFHPVVQEAAQTLNQTRNLIEAVRSTLIAQGIDVLWFAPNTDAGSAGILQVLGDLKESRVKSVSHLPREQYLPALNHSELLVGNSSSGIIEAATFGTPVVNVGNRQRSRERNHNTLDCAYDVVSITDAIRHALLHGRYPAINRYGDGHSGAVITALLANQPLSADLLDKINTF
jgi:GDP/UDP-N,N'-diacetylbacillosamine 2-epimerase (hydrolysing)